MNDPIDTDLSDLRHFAVHGPKESNMPRSLKVTFTRPRSEYLASLALPIGERLLSPNAER